MADFDLSSAKPIEPAKPSAEGFDLSSAKPIEPAKPSAEGFDLSSAKPVYSASRNTTVDDLLPSVKVVPRDDSGDVPGTGFDGTFGGSRQSISVEAPRVMRETNKPDPFGVKYAEALGNLVQEEQAKKYEQDAKDRENRIATRREEVNREQLAEATDRRDVAGTPTRLDARNQRIKDAKRTIGLAVSNAPDSAEAVYQGLDTAITNPVQTIKDIALATGGIARAIDPTGMVGFDEATNKAMDDKAAAITKYISDRYGSWDRARATFENDPVGLLNDISVATGLGKIAVRGVAGGVEGAGNLARDTPLNAGTVEAPAGHAATIVDTTKRAADTINRVGDALGTVSEITNPLAPITHGASAVSETAKGLRNFDAAEGATERKAGTAPSTEALTKEQQENTLASRQSGGVAEADNVSQMANGLLNRLQQDGYSPTNPAHSAFIPIETELQRLTGVDKDGNPLMRPKYENGAPVMEPGPAQQVVGPSGKPMWTTGEPRQVMEPVSVDTSLRDLIDLRKRLDHMNGAATADFVAQAKKTIDEFIADTENSPARITENDKFSQPLTNENQARYEKGSASYKASNMQAAQLFKDDLVQRALSNALAQGGDFASVVRENINDIIKDRAKFNQFTPHEQRMLYDIARGNTSGILINGLAKANSAWGAGASAGLGVVTMALDTLTSGLGLSALVTGVGKIASNVRNSSALTAVNQLSADIRRGGKYNPGETGLRPGATQNAFNSLGYGAQQPSGIYNQMAAQFGSNQQRQR